MKKRKARIVRKQSLDGGIQNTREDRVKGYATSDGKGDSSDEGVLTRKGIFK